MTGQDLKQARLKKNWTQEETARKLGVSQAYVSLVEGNHRALSMRLVQKLLNTEVEVSPTALPVRSPDNSEKVSTEELANSLGALGYPGFSYVHTRPRQNPAELLLCALTQTDLDSRVAEGLPWLMLKYSEMDRDWLAKNAKEFDLQNRLGYVVTLARELAEKQNDQTKKVQLSQYESMLDRSRLAREDTFCHESLSQAERNWLRERRPPEAVHWNLLTDLTVDQLSHATQ